MSRLLMTFVAIMLALVAGQIAQAAGPYQATGFKVGEISPRKAIVWTRLTRNQTPNPADAPMVEFVYEEGRGRQPLLEIVWPDAGAWRDIGISTLLSYSGAMLLTWAYARAETQRLAPLEYTGFLWAVLFGWLFFAEAVTLTTTAGAALIVAGCWIATRGKPPEPEQTAL